MSFTFPGLLSQPTPPVGGGRRAWTRFVPGREPTADSGVASRRGDGRCNSTGRVTGRCLREQPHAPDHPSANRG
jgi:hypothetical protein